MKKITIPIFFCAFLAFAGILVVNANSCQIIKNKYPIKVYMKSEPFDFKIESSKYEFYINYDEISKITEGYGDKTYIFITKITDKIEVVKNNAKILSSSISKLINRGSVIPE